MIGKINNVIKIPTSINGRFFKYWFDFLRPFHKLTEKETEVIACLVKERYNLSKVIKDSEILDRVTMGEETRRKVREECNINLPYFQVIIGKLRKTGVIVDGKINPRYIPNIIEDNNQFHLLLLFDFNDIPETTKEGQ